MTTKGHRSQLARPWYISLTAVWQDDAENLQKLNALVASVRVPRHHLLIPENCRHCTVVAIMKINGHPVGTENMRDFARRIFEPIRSNSGLVNGLTAEFKFFTARAYEVRCFDNGTVVQFTCDQHLEEFRRHARTFLDAPVSLSVKGHTNSEAGRSFREERGVELVESMLYDPSKNFGTKAFGSIARSPCRSDDSTERWCESLTGVELKFKKIHFLVSDEMLSNPRNSEEDALIE
jgi:hypothetical protein